MRRLGVLLAACLPMAAACIALSPAAAKEKTHSFAGSCDFEGTVRFDPPLGGTSQRTTATATATGRCSGSLTDAGGRTERLDAAPVRYFAESSGDQSCGAGPESTGSGYLSFAHAKIYFSLSETRVGPTGRITLTGRAGGSFSGPLMATGDPLTTASSCAGGGVAESGFTLSGSTDPAISG